MRVGPEHDLHLTYCTNIHPGESWAEVFANLQDYTLPLKDRLSPNAPYGIGLRLSDQAARDLLEEGELGRFKKWLDDNAMYVFTLNGFPYGGFHRTTVKEHVYRPDWRSEERVEYTLRLARILAALLPDGVEGSISTCPISYKPWLTAEERPEALRTGAANLARVAAELHLLHQRMDVLIHIGLEPEPDCLVENTTETIDFFQNYLLAADLPVTADDAGEGGDTLSPEEILLSHIGVCVDTCHFAVEYESPVEAIERFEEAGIRTSKIQISAALRVELESDRENVSASLEPFAESTYLHQVVGCDADKRLVRYPDLPAALPGLKRDPSDEWRIHYHVPVFVDEYDRLRSTREEITETLRLLERRHPTTHLEIETYTWDVLPDDLKTDVVTSIEREYRWVLDEISANE